MKIMKISPKTAIQAVVSGVVIGALLSRDYPKEGLVVSACFIAFYLGLTFRRRMCYLLHFVSGGIEKRFLAVSWLCTLYLLVAALVAGTVYNFFLLLALGLDYFLYDKRQRASAGKEKGAGEL